MNTIPLSEPVATMGEAIALHQIPGRQIVLAIPVHDEGSFHCVYIALREGSGPFATYASLCIEADGSVRQFHDHRYNAEAAISFCFQNAGWGPVIVGYFGEPICHNQDDECFGDIINGRCDRHTD